MKCEQNKEWHTHSTSRNINYLNLLDKTLECLLIYFTPHILLTAHMFDWSCIEGR